MFRTTYFPTFQSPMSWVWIVLNCWQNPKITTRQPLYYCHVMPNYSWTQQSSCELKKKPKTYTKLYKLRLPAPPASQCQHGACLSDKRRICLTVGWNPIRIRGDILGENCQCPCVLSPQGRRYMVERTSVEALRLEYSRKWCPVSETSPVFKWSRLPRYASFFFARRSQKTPFKFRSFLRCFSREVGIRVTLTNANGLVRSR